MQMTISSTVFDQLVATAAADPVREVCGLLLGSDTHIASLSPARNVAADPARRFEVDPAVQFGAIRAARAGGAAVIGHYHSHPTGKAVPSACDAAMIARAGELWLIIAGPQVRAWLSRDRGFVEMDLSVVPDAAPNACVAS